MTLLDRYLAKRLVATLVKALVVLVLVFVLIDLLTHRRSDIIRYDVPWSVVAQYYAVFTPEILYKYQVAALAMLTAVLLVFGEAAENNEITAAFAGGVSLGRLVLAPALIGIALSASAFVFQETVGIPAARKTAAIDRVYFTAQRPQTRHGVTWGKLPGGWTCHISKFNRIALTGEHVFLYDVRGDKIEQIRADRIYWDDRRGKWIVEDGFRLVLYADKGWLKRCDRIRQAEAPIAVKPAELFALDAPAETKTVATLQNDILRAAEQGVPAIAQRVGLHAKFSQPALSFVMIWLAVPFAMRMRRGGLAVGFGMGIAIALAYLVLFRIGIGLGYMGHLAPPLAAWLANAIFLCLGIGLFRNTAT